MSGPDRAEAPASDTAVKPESAVFSPGSSSTHEDELFADGAETVPPEEEAAESILSAALTMQTGTVRGSQSIPTTVLM